MARIRPLGSPWAILASGFGRLPVLLEAVRFEHTIFALPFAYLGLLLAARGLPTWHQFLWITMAMVGARTMAMGANRLVDRQMDALNPRTRQRPLPTGRLSVRAMLSFSLGGMALMVFSAWQLNELCLKLAPLAIVVLVGYSYVKYYSWWTHAVLGIADGGAPVGGWIAVTGTLSWEPLLLGLAVAFWVGGFDLLYACQDVAFDREHRIHSVALRFGVGAALLWSSLSHALTLGLLLVVGVMMALGWPYWAGLAVASALLVYEHRLVSPQDLSRLDLAFFNVNGYIAVVMFLATALALFVEGTALSF